jgi:hypothetical protein
VKQADYRYWISALVCCVVLALGQSDAAARRVITPTDNAAIQSDWLLNGQTSILEDPQARPFRWLTATPKDPIPVLNHTLDMSLLHATVALVQWAGIPVWQRTSVVLQHDVPAELRVTGVGRAVKLPIGPTVRRFSLLLPYGFHPVQTRIEPLTTHAYDAYGFHSDQVLQTSGDDRPRIARWYGTDTQTFLPLVLQIALRLWLLLPLGIALLWWRRTGAWYAPGLTTVLWALPWGWAFATGTPLSVEPIVAAVVSGACWAMLRRLHPDALQATMYVVVAAAVGMTGMHAYATAQWMSGVDLGQFEGIGSFLNYLAHMRMAFPIPLLSMEYLLSQSSLPGLFSIGYLTIACRVALLIGLLSALARCWRTPRGLWVGALVLAGAVAGSGFVLRYYDRNVWMVYDALLGTSLVLLVRWIQRDQPTSRRWWLLLGLLLGWLDSLRPFMMLVVPCIVFWLVLRSRNQRVARQILWLCMPLLPNLAWHLYHITVLGQWSWSSHAGMNLARAWIPAAALEAMRAAPADMNSAAYLAASNALLAQTRQWIAAHPLDAVVRALELVWAMVTVPVEMARLNDGGVYTVIAHTADPLVWGYRIIVGVALGVQVVWVGVGLRRGGEWRAPLWLHAAVVTAIVLVSALTEYGEQARFLAAMVPAILLGVIEHSTTLRQSMQQRRKNV